VNWRVSIKGAVIPGQREALDPVSILPVVDIDSGLAAFSKRPGMTVFVGM